MGLPRSPPSPRRVSRFEEYWKIYGKRLVAEFIRTHVPNEFVATNVQIFDSYETAAREIDVAVCNQYQLFRAPNGGLLMAEGVDFVIQVKALLTTPELERMLKNAASLRALRRKQSQFDVATQGPAGGEMHAAGFGERLPYLCVAYRSELRMKTVHARLKELSEATEHTYLPDAVFVLEDGFTVIHIRPGTENEYFEPMVTEDGPARPTGTGWLALKTGDETLQHLIRFAYVGVPYFLRVIPPARHYFGMERAHRVVLPSM